MSQHPMSKSIWTKMPKIPKGVCAGARSWGELVTEGETNGLFTPQAVQIRPYKQTPGLGWSQHLKKLKSKFHPDITQPLALFYGMLLVAQTNLLTFPIVLPTGHCPSVEHNQQTPPAPPPPSPPPDTNGWLHLDAKRNQRIPCMC